MIVSTGPKLPIAAAFTEQKQVDEEAAKRVTSDALAVDTPIWMVGDAAFDMLDWHDDLIEEGVVPVAPYYLRNTDDPKDIEYRIEDRIDEHNEDVHLKQSMLEETHNCRAQVERTIGASKECGLGTPCVRVKTHVFLACVSDLRSLSPTTNEVLTRERHQSKCDNYSVPLCYSVNQTSSHRKKVGMSYVCPLMGNHGEYCLGCVGVSTVSPAPVWRGDSSNS